MLPHLSNACEPHPYPSHELARHEHTMAFPHLEAWSYRPYPSTIEWIHLDPCHHWIFYEMGGSYSAQESDRALANFIKEHILCPFGISYKIVSNNGTSFINKDIWAIIEYYKIKHRRSTPYYLQRNGQVEGTNTVLLGILSKMVFDYVGGWNTHLLDTL